jgi:hypothetical protein
MDGNQFQRDKEIDPNQLDVECVRQSDRLHHWAEQAVEAGYRMDRAKLKLEVTKARLEIQCRRKPADFGLAEAREKGIEAAVIAHEEYQDAYKAWLDARKEAKLLDAAVNSMESKRRMLEGLIKLHGQQYFAGPNVPKDLVSSWKEYQDRLSMNVNTKQKSKARLRRRRGE